MLRCPQCGQTSRAILDFGTEDAQPLTFKRKAALLDSGAPATLVVDEVLLCPFCRRKATLGAWQEARRRPASDWDEEEDIGEISDHRVMTLDDVETFEDLQRVPETEDLYGGDDDGSDH
jgi:hypothetical protein